MFKLNYGLSSDLAAQSQDRQPIKTSLKLVSAIFVKLLFFHQMIALSLMIMENVFISSKKLFSLSRFQVFS